MGNTRISGYAPGTDVVDHGNIDLDQAEMEVELELKTEEGFAAAKVIYEEGGNSKVSATMTFLSGSNTKWPISPGTVLYGAGTTGLIVSGSGSSSGGPPTDCEIF